MKDHYFRLPNQIFDEDLTTSEFVVYSYLVKCSDKIIDVFRAEKILQINAMFP